MLSVMQPAMMPVDRSPDDDHPAGAIEL